MVVSECIFKFDGWLLIVANHWASYVYCMYHLLVIVFIPLFVIANMLQVITPRYMCSMPEIQL